ASDCRAPKVYLTSGGSTGNAALFEETHGIPLYRGSWIPTNTGHGITLGRSAGGFTRGGESYLCDFGSIPGSLDFPSHEFARSIHHPQRRQPWEIVVNKGGERFLREDEPSVDGREREL